VFASDKESIMFKRFFILACCFAIISCASGDGGSGKAIDGGGAGGNGTPTGGPGTGITTYTNAAGLECEMAKEQNTNRTHEVCCAQQGEHLAKTFACDRHTAFGCELNGDCIWYTDDGTITNPCPGGYSCKDCASAGYTGTVVWCGDQHGA
jgi:hypothetical protein